MCLPYKHLRGLCSSHSTPAERGRAWKLHQSWARASPKTRVYTPIPQGLFTQPSHFSLFKDGIIKCLSSPLLSSPTSSSSTSSFAAVSDSILPILKFEVPRTRTWGIFPTPFGASALVVQGQFLNSTHRCGCVVFDFPSFNLVSSRPVDDAGKDQVYFLKEDCITWCRYNTFSLHSLQLMSSWMHCIFLALWLGLQWSGTWRYFAAALFPMTPETFLSTVTFLSPGLETFILCLRFSLRFTDETVCIFHEKCDGLPCFCKVESKKLR